GSTPAAAATPDPSAGQRGWNRHPDGIRAGSGGSPPRITAALPAPADATERRACVYGCLGERRIVSTGPVSTIRPRYITATRSATFHASPRSWVTTRAERPEFVLGGSRRLKMFARSEAATDDNGSAAFFQKR